MHDILKLVSVLGFTIYLLRRKMKIGPVMLLSSALLSVLYLMRPSDIICSAYASATSPITIKLLSALILIRMLEMVLREREILSRMMQVAGRAFKSRKTVIVSMPLLIGMLPSVGGAYFSAPMVEEASKGMDMKPEEKAFVNYCFRHPWEFILPLYPGVLLASAVSGIGLRTIILYNLSYAVLLFLGGFISSMRGIQRQGAKREATMHGLASFIPLASVISLVIVLGIELYIAILVVIAGLMAYYRYGAGDVWRTLKYGLSMEVVLLIFGVMLFKALMDASGAVGGISEYLTDRGIPLLPLLFALPFSAGLLTGLTIGFVGATFPLIVSLAGGAHAGTISFAFASGFLGVMFSPVHVCLVLTKEYFKSDLWGIYRRLSAPALLVMAGALFTYFASSAP